MSIKSTATLEDLLKLEDAILSSGGKVEKSFNEYVQLVDRASSWEVDELHRTTVLRHCWDVLQWRPRQGKVVKPNN